MYIPNADSQNVPTVITISRRNVWTLSIMKQLIKVPRVITKLLGYCNKQSNVPSLPDNLCSNVHFLPECPSVNPYPEVQSVQMSKFTFDLSRCIYSYFLLLLF